MFIFHKLCTLFYHCVLPSFVEVLSSAPGAHLSINMMFYQYKNSHYKDKMVCIYNANTHTWKDLSLYWDRALVFLCDTFTHVIEDCLNECQWNNNPEEYWWIISLHRSLTKLCAYLYEYLIGIQLMVAGIIVCKREFGVTQYLCSCTF